MTEKFLRVSKPTLGGGGYLIPINTWKEGVLNEFDCLLDSQEVGEDLLFEIVEHDRDEFDNAPEFAGW